MRRRPGLFPSERYRAKRMGTGWIRLRMGCFFVVHMGKGVFAMCHSNSFFFLLNFIVHCDTFSCG
ncbi:hypothetical protein CGRA01v4_01703 [Colletotrichum graminicola]|nr:hypothetical protein CGRA01v4_01703 [Colletotrichum graminicola]